MKHKLLYCIKIFNFLYFGTLFIFVTFKPPSKRENSTHNQVLVLMLKVHVQLIFFSKFYEPRREKTCLWGFRPVLTQEEKFYYPSSYNKGADLRLCFPIGKNLVSL